MNEELLKKLKNKNAELQLVIQEIIEESPKDSITPFCDTLECEKCPLEQELSKTREKALELLNVTKELMTTLNCYGEKKP